jgi:hypothetical protein
MMVLNIFRILREAVKEGLIKWVNGCPKDGLFGHTAPKSLQINFDNERNPEIAPGLAE